MSQAVAVEQVTAESIAPYRRDAMARAVRLIAPNGADGIGVQQLYSVPVAWGTHYHAIEHALSSMPKLQSPRRRGVAPPYPRTSQLEKLREGTLVLFANGFVLEPKDRRFPCINVASSSVNAATFYSDAFDVVLTSRERLVIQTANVDRIDSIFQAYFWNSVS